MKKGTTSIQNIETETAEQFRSAKMKYQAEKGKEVTNDEFLLELLK